MSTGDDSRDYLTRVPDSYVRCRLWGHAWDCQQRGYRVEGKGRERVYVQDLHCLRCGTARHDSYSPRTLELVSRQYGYAEGYQHQGGVVSRQETRRFVAAEMRDGPRTRG